MTDAAKHIAAAIAFVTAVVGFAQLVYGGRSWFLDVLPWLGVTYFVLFVGVLAYGVVKPERNVSRWSLAGNFIIVAGLGSFLFYVYGSGFATLFGIAGVLAAVVSVALIYVDFRRTRHESKKACPDCAEDVKAAANVCRYCGHRFPPKTWVGSMTPVQRARAAKRPLQHTDS